MTWHVMQWYVVELMACGVDLLTIAGLRKSAIQLQCTKKFSTSIALHICTSVHRLRWLKSLQCEAFVGQRRSLSVTVVKLAACQQNSRERIAKPPPGRYQNEKSLFNLFHLADQPELRSRRRHVIMTCGLANYLQWVAEASSAACRNHSLGGSTVAALTLSPIT